MLKLFWSSVLNIQNYDQKKNTKVRVFRRENSEFVNVKCSLGSTVLDIMFYKSLYILSNVILLFKDQDEAEVGIIESVSLRNFMCHSQLEFKFGPNVNFVTGKNGSEYIVHHLVAIRRTCPLTQNTTIKTVSIHRYHVTVIHMKKL